MSKQSSAKSQLSNFPDLLRAKIAPLGISEENYDMWVAGHEAAHAVVGIKYGGELELIGTSSEYLGTKLSRARCEWKPLTGIMTWGQILDLIAAGPAYDDLNAAQYGITDDVRKHVAQDRITADEKVLPNITGSDSDKDAAWINAIERVKTLIADPFAALKIKALQQVIYDSIRAGNPFLLGDQVRIVVMQTT